MTVRSNVLLYMNTHYPRSLHEHTQHRALTVVISQLSRSNHGSCGGDFTASCLELLRAGIEEGVRDPTTLRRGLDGATNRHRICMRPDRRRRDEDPFPIKGSTVFEQILAAGIKIGVCHITTPEHSTAAIR